MLVCPSLSFEKMKRAAHPSEISLKSPGWLLALIPLLTMQIIYPNKVWIILIVGLSSACLTAFIWAKSLQKNLRLEREMRYGWAHVGDRFEERFTLINRGMFPAIWVEIVDESNLPGYITSQVRAIAGDSRTSWQRDHLCTQRGLFTLGPTYMVTGDPLGLFQVKRELRETTALMITPPVVPLPKIEVTPGGRAGEGRRARPDPLERTVGASGVRPYLPGDPLRWVHWPISVHKQELYVRNFESTPASDWWIFLDLEAHAQVGEGWNSTLEHGIILAASLADRGLRQGRAVGLAAAGEQLIWLRPNGSAEQRLQILRELALAKTGETPLDQLLFAGRQALQRGASLIVITPNLSLEWLEQITFFVHSRLLPTVLLFDHASYGGSGDFRRVLAELAGMGISPSLIQRELLERPEAHPGHQGEWQWRVTGFGRAIPIHKPADLSWRKIGG